MIARLFHASASAERAPTYAAFFRDRLLPELAAIPGHRGALVMDRPHPSGEVAITVITFWDSMQAIERFAGDHPERAVVEPEARAILSSFADEVVHWTVQVSSLGVE
jgi:heme-degrading monooxygenase HmoA